MRTLGGALDLGSSGIEQDDRKWGGPPSRGHYLRRLTQRPKLARHSGRELVLTAEGLALVGQDDGARVRACVARLVSRKPFLKVDL